MEGEHKSDPPPDLPPAEHEEALRLEKSRKIEKLRQSRDTRDLDAEAELPQVHSDDV